MDIHVDSLHSDAFAFVRESHHHPLHHHLPLPDFNGDSSHFTDSLSPKGSLKDLDDTLHHKPLFRNSSSGELLDDFIGSTSSSPGDSPNIRDSDEPHNLDLSPPHSTHNGMPMHISSVALPIALPPGGTTVIDGVTYNNRGYEVCGALNKFNKPCQRIGRCPFHPDHNKKPETPAPQAPQPAHAPHAPESITAVEPRKMLPIKKGPYKSGWKKDEHLRFLKGLQIHGRGSWKDIALIVGTRTPTQIQVHAHRYYLRQQQGTKNKRSIHDISLEDLEELEVQHGSIMPGPQSPLPQLSPPSPDPNSPNDITQLFQHSNSYSHHSPQNNHMHSPPSPSIHSTSSSYPGPSSTGFPPLFPSSSASSLPNTLPLPGCLTPLPIPGSSSSFSMNYHSSSWFASSPFPPMSNLNSLGDDNLAPLPPSFSNDDCEDEEITDIDFDVSHHHINHHIHHDEDDD